jgi:hypothetical protein
LSAGTVKNSGVSNAKAARYCEYRPLETIADIGGEIHHSAQRSELEGKRLGNHVLPF